MQTVSADLVAALRERLTVIGDAESRCHPERHMARLREISERIDRLQASLPEPVDPRLRHYLERRSYDKALEFLSRT